MESNTSLQQQLLEAGVHFGHLRKKWNPKMLPYIYAEKKGIHIIDLNKTVDCLQETAAALKSIAKQGRKIMFVGTKKQAKEIVTECAKRVGMPYVTERWLGEHKLRGPFPGPGPASLALLALHTRLLRPADNAGTQQ